MLPPMAFVRDLAEVARFNVTQTQWFPGAHFFEVEMHPSSLADPVI